MPTVEDLGKKVKAKYPGAYDDIPDADLGARVKAKYPGKYDDFEGGSTFDKMSVSQRAKKNVERETAIAGLPTGTSSRDVTASIQKTGQEEQAASDKKAYGQFAATMGKGAAVGVAGLFTGGLGLGGGLALMGGTGLLSSIAGAGIEEATGTHKGLGERASDVAVDTGLALAGEGAVRGIGYFAKTLLPAAAVRAAARSQQGEAVLNTIRQTKLNGIMEDIRVATPSKKAGEFLVDASGPLKKAYQEIETVAKQKGTGEFFGQRFGGFTDKAQEGITAIEGHLKLARRGGQIGDLQPLDGVIRAKQSFQQYAHDPALSDTERKIFTKAAEGLNDVVRKNLKVIGQDTLYSYDQLNAIGRAQFRAGAADQLVRRAIYGSFGAAVGGHYGGATGGLALGAAAAASPDIASFVLEHLAENPKAAVTARRAVDLLANGGTKAAVASMKTAVDQLGMQNIIRSATRPPDANPGQ